MSDTVGNRNVSSEKETKRNISSSVAEAVRSLQQSYVPSGKFVTSDEDEANKLCSALEATFMHGLKDKYLYGKAPSDKRVRRNHQTSHGMPEPIFWSLLKSITHRNVLVELNGLKFINTDIGRCRAWLRLALNDGLMECYVASLLREKTTLADAYHPTAFLMDPEETTIFISFLQGTASLTFTLSYKSGILNKWTTTPLVLAGLLPPSLLSNVDSQDRRPSVSSIASSSSDGSSGAFTTIDAVEVIRGVPKRSNSQSERLGVGPGQARHEVAIVDGVENMTPQQNRLHSEERSRQVGGHESWRARMAMDETLAKPANATVDGMDCTQSTHYAVKSSHNCEVEGVISTSGSVTDVNGFGPCSDFAQGSISDCTVRCAVMPNLSEKFGIRPSGLQCNILPPDDMTVSSCSTPLTDGVNSHTSPASSAIPSDEVSPAVEAMEDQFSLNVGLVTNANSKPGPLNLQAKCPSDGVRGAAISLNGALLRTTGITVSPSGLSVDNDEVTPETPPGASDDDMSRRISRSRDLFGSDEDIYKLSAGGKEVASEMNSALPTIVGRPVPAASSSAVSDAEHTSMSSSAPSSSLSNIVVVHKRKTGVHNPFQNILKMGNLEKRAGTISLWKEYHCVLTPMALQLFNPGTELHGKPNEVFMLAACQGMNRGGSSSLFQVGGGGRCCLELTFPGSRMQLRAPSEEQADDWMERLQEAIAAMQCLPNDDNDRDNKGPQNCSTSAPPHPEPMVEESSLTQLLVHGVLKLQQKHQKTPGVGQVWKSFYFTLDKDALRRYAMSDRSGAPVRTHDTHELRDVSRDLGAPRRFCVVAGSDTLHLCAVSEMEARLWVNTLRRLQGQQPGLLEYDCGSSGQASRRNGEAEEEGTTITSLFLTLLTELPMEKGLDAQCCKCAGCHRDIGFRYGKAKVCLYSRRYYCEHCHADDLVLIPGRVLHNWDISPQKVAKQAKEFLEYVAEEPLLDVSEVNPQLYMHVTELASLRTMRLQLKSLRAYLFTCRSIVADELRQRVFPREYLLTHMHLYSITDLQQVIDGRFAPFLAKTIKFASDHVYSCGLCSQKGFICEICNSSDIIYPFEVSSTTRCDRCQAVFHKACKGSTVPCPKCVRRELRTIQRYSRPEEHRGPSQGMAEFPYSSSP